MAEIPSLSAEERAELERLRSEVATLRSQVQAGGAKPARPRAAVGWRQRRRTIVCIWGWPPRGIGRRRRPLADCGIEGLA